MSLINGTNGVDCTEKQNLVNGEVKIKNYRIRNSNWFCESCNVYCNSESQHEVHLISQKHKFVTNKPNEPILAKEDEKTKSEKLIKLDENGSTYKARISFSIAEIKQNPLAKQFQIDPLKYLITEDKKVGKFEKFGFYCKTCDSYMTGQIQLIMHVRGAKHQYFNEGEIPGYKNTSNKKYNPHQRRKNKQSRQNTKLNMVENDYINRVYKNSVYTQPQSNGTINNHNNTNTNRVPKSYGVGHQNIFEHVNNSINNTTIYSMPHLPPIKMNNEAHKENNFIENRGPYTTHNYKANMMFQSPLQSSAYNISKLAQNPGMQYPQNNIIQSPSVRYTPDIFGANNDRLYQYNLNVVSNGLSQMQLKEEKNEREEIYAYTPPPEPNLYQTNGVNFNQKTMDFQQQTQQLQAPPQQLPSRIAQSSQFIFPTRPVSILMTNIPQSPITAGSFQFYPTTPTTQQPQLTQIPPQIPTQQVHQTF